jgi:phosphonate transport system substrate-binding protein
MHGLAIIRRDMPSPSAAPSTGPLRIAFASPYCSARSLAKAKLLHLAGKRPVIWVPEGSEHAVFTALAENRATLGIVRTATVMALEKELPGIWSIVQSAGRAPVWTLVGKRQLPPRIHSAVKQQVAKMPLNVLDTAGFMRFSILPDA